MIDQPKPVCAHKNIVSIVNTYNAGAMPGFAEVSIKCTDCGEPFCFVGVNRGLSAQIPTINNDATELRIPIVPKSSVPPAAVMAPAPAQGKPS